MKSYLLIIPIALLVTYSQLIVKWRADAQGDVSQLTIIERLIKFCMDPVIMSSYLAALIASFAWLFVVTRLELTVAYPVYIGMTFVMVLLGGVFLLSEVMTTAKIISMLLIFSGIVVGLMSDV